MTGPGTRYAAAVARAYDSTGQAWAWGAARVYDRLADALVAAAPVPVAGRRVLDVGAGTGAASRAVARRGGLPVALDRSSGMLRAGDPGIPAAVADAAALPVATGAAGGAVAAFSLNHLHDPAAGLAEMRRACRPGSPLVAAAYAADDGHPVKRAVERAVSAVGWRPDTWYDELRSNVVARLATTEGMADAAARAGVGGDVRRMDVPIAGLTADDLLAWRLGMAQVAPFLATLDDATRASVVRQARALLGPGPPPLIRSVIVLLAVA
jgi:ubiquinone/menaquinone biosynthesis C-methylase UbiE